MPKNEIDYSNTIIYKITCLDPNIIDVYVGHTTNFVQRKHSHKTSCVNDKTANYKCKLYETIRCNGGWCNWKMEIVNFFNCADHYEARKKEQEYFTLLNANLNSIEPLPKPIMSSIEKKVKKLIYCQTCNIYLQNIQLLEKHNNTKKHIKLCNSNNLILDKTQTYFCEKCNFKCCKNSDWERHLITQKHRDADKILTHIDAENASTNKVLVCSCGKEYKHRQSLFVHKKKCIPTLDINNVPEPNSKITNSNDLIQYLMKENLDFKNLIMELVKKDTIL